MRRYLLYGVVIALGAFGLQYVDYLHSVRRFSTQLYIGLIATAFTGLGVWVGMRLTGAPRSSGEFARNERVIETLGISPREVEVLELLAEGLSNKEIAERLFVSSHTVKSHLSHLYDKLDVSRRTQAVQKARTLGILG